MAVGLGLAAAYYVSVRIVPDRSGYFQAFRYWIRPGQGAAIAATGRRGRIDRSAKGRSVALRRLLWRLVAGC